MRGFLVLRKVEGREFGDEGFYDESGSGKKWQERRGFFLGCGDIFEFFIGC